MKKSLICLLAGVLLYAGAASADSYREVWQCKAEEGNTVEDVQAVNSKWLAWMRKNVDEDIDSAVLTAVIGQLDGFIFVDTYPSLDTWSEGRGAQEDDEEMEEIQEAFNELLSCSENSLLRHRPTT